MAYTVYTTEGIVLSRTVVSEATVLCRIYTKEFGALTIRAESGARSKKFAPSLQMGTVGVYDFVRSRSGFRLTGIQPLSTVQARNYTDESIRFVRMCCSYVTRFVPSDESADAELYSFLIGALSFARKNTWSENWWNSFRLKLLGLLGYVSDIHNIANRADVERVITEGEIAAQL